MGMMNIAKDVVKNRLGMVCTPGFITYYVTLKCNHRCFFCDVWKRDKANNGEMNLEEIEKAFSTVPKIEVLRISGGEPFMRKDIADIVNVLDERLSPGIIHFTTNGLSSEKTLRDVMRMKSKRKIHIKVSIDNLREKHDAGRGIKGAYDHAMETVQGLARLAKEHKFHVGVNQAIVAEEDIPSYATLKDMLAPLGVQVYPVIAHQYESSLYDDRPEIIASDVTYKPINKFSREAMVGFIRQVQADAEKVGDFKEKLVNNYHWKGLYNRLLKDEHSPNPPCVAVNNHMRVLPNGDVPTCYYNKTVVGNLLKQSFEEIWWGDKAGKARQWVAACSGCWQSCETAVSGIYTGDVVKGLRFKMDEA